MPSLGRSFGIAAAAAIQATPTPRLTRRSRPDALRPPGVRRRTIRASGGGFGGDLIDEMKDRNKQSTPVALLVVVASIMAAYFAWIVSEMARTTVSSRHAVELFGALGVAIAAGLIGLFIRRPGQRQRDRQR
jgi:hypothetical protein